MNKPHLNPNRKVKTARDAITGVRFAVETLTAPKEPKGIQSALQQSLVKRPVSRATTTDLPVRITASRATTTDLPDRITVSRAMKGPKLPKTLPLKVNRIAAVVTADAAVVAEALKRNYPDVTPEALLERLDLVNVGPVFQAILKASGLAQNERKEAGAAPFGGATSTD